MHERTRTTRRHADFGLVATLVMFLILDTQASLLGVAGVAYAYFAFTAFPPLSSRRAWSIPIILFCLTIGGFAHLENDPLITLRASLALTLVSALLLEWSNSLNRRKGGSLRVPQFDDLSTRQLLPESRTDDRNHSAIPEMETGAFVGDPDSDYPTSDSALPELEDSDSTSSSEDSSFDTSHSPTSFETYERLKATGAFSKETLEAIRTLAMQERQAAMHLAQCRAAGLLSKFQLHCIRAGCERDLRVGRYTVQAVIGRGAMGVVYLAVDRTRNRQVALKMYRNPGDQLGRIRREMAVLEKLAHPNIVVSLEVGQSGGRHFIAMEYVQGETLQQVLRRCGPLPPRDALPMMLQVAMAIEQAHAREILHRDIKPGNIMLTRSGECKVLDLGISLPPKEIREFDTAEIDGPLVCGTVGFMAPEQARGRGELDQRTDLFAIGCTLYMLLTGELMIPGDCLIDRLRNTFKPTDWRALDTDRFTESLCKIVSKLTAPQPEDRYQSVGELIPELRREVRRVGVQADDRLIHVLVVERWHEENMLSKRLLERSNHSLEISHAGDFASACDAAWIHCESSSLPLIVLLDLNLPDSVPLETAERISRLSGKQVHVIAMADGNDKPLRGMCLRSGAVDYLCKESTTDVALERVVFRTFGRLPSPDRLTIDT